MAYQSKTNNISDQDYHTLVDEFNATDDVSLIGNRLDQLFENVVNNFPDNIALIHNETEVSFKELNASANILARSLAGRGLKKGDVVGLAVSRSVDLIIVMLAVLKLGALMFLSTQPFPRNASIKWLKMPALNLSFSAAVRPKAWRAGKTYA